MMNKKIEQFLSITEKNYGYVTSLEFKWDRIGKERTFTLYIVLGGDTEKQCHIVFYDVNRLKIAQPVASGILFCPHIAPEKGTGPFQMKNYYHVNDTDENWLELYCADFDFVIE